MSKEALFEFGRRELSKLPPQWGLVIAMREARIRCPFHNNGQERTPSLKINLDPEAPAPALWTYCRGCKHNAGWNTLAATLRLRQLESSKEKNANAAEVNLTRRRHITLDAEEFALPALHKLMDWPVTAAWRTIPGPTLREFKCKTITWGRRTMLYIPVMQYGDHVGGIRAVLERDRSNKAEKAYINTDGAWSSGALLGFDRAMRMPDRPLWTVEGPRDTMHVASAGVRDVGMIGSALTAKKIALIRDLDPPAIVSAGDGDEPGDGLHEALVKEFAKEIPVVRYPFADGQDPCDLPLAKIQEADERVSRLIRRAA